MMQEQKSNDIEIVQGRVQQLEDMEKERGTVTLELVSSKLVVETAAIEL